jgi:proton glutamate symport protein
LSESTRVVVALAAAVAGGIAIAASGIAPLIRAADFIAPVGTLWVNAIRMTVIPLVASLLVAAVISTGDVNSMGRTGGRTLLVFFLLLAGTAMVVMPLATLVSRLLPQHTSAHQLPIGATEASGEITTAGQVQTFSNWLASLLPSNAIAAAASGAMMPLILFILLFALAIAHSPASTRETLGQFFRALGDAMLLLVRWVIRMAPIGVFALVLPLAVHAGGTLAGAIGFYIIAYSIASVAVTLLLYVVVSLVARIPIRRFGQAALPAQLIAFSSSSSIAALPALVEGAEVRLALPKSVTGFVLPLAVSTFKIAAPVSWATGAVFVGWFYGIPLPVGNLAMIAFAAVFLSFAAPGIPRGAFIMLTPLFLTIGLPAEGIGILIAVDAIPDTFATVLNTTGNLAAAALVAPFAEAETTASPSYSLLEGQ